MTQTDLTRRRVLATGSAGLIAATLPGLAGLDAAAAAGRPVRRPHIVWFLSEDNNPFVGAYGDRLAHTPTIDGLAADGLLFEVAYSPAPVCAPSRFTYLTGVPAESCGPAHHMRGIATLPGFMRGFPAYLRDAGYYTTNNYKTDYNAVVDLDDIWDDCSGTAHWRSRPKGAPFFAQFTSMTTHEIQMFKPTAGTVGPDDVTVPAYLPDSPETRQDIASYHNLMERMDGELATRLAELEEDGLAEDTIIFYFGDNGGVLPWSKRFSNERGHLVPLVVRIPPAWQHLAPAPPGSRITSPVEGLDFAPTTLALAGLTPPTHMKGRMILGDRPRPHQMVFGQRSRMDERYDLQRSVRTDRHLYTRNYQPWRPYGQYLGFMFLQSGYQVWLEQHLAGTLDATQDRFWGEKPFEELYDLEADPDQLHNLATDPAAASTLQPLRDALHRHLVLTHDNGFIPEGHPSEGWRASRRPGAYPIKRVLHVAATAARRNPDKADRLLDWLGHEHDLIRFWAAQGVLGLGDALPHGWARTRRRFERESSVFVRIPLAEALGGRGDTEAVAWLARTVETHRNVRVRLQAINALTYLDPEAVVPHLDVVVGAGRSSEEYLGRAGRYLAAVLTGTFDPRSPVQ